MNKNKIIIYVTLLLILLLISIPSVLKAINKHNDRLENVAIKKIIATAKKCYYNESCVDEKITLSELYEKMDLEEVINPITKSVYSPESYVSVKDNFKFTEK